MKEIFCFDGIFEMDVFDVMYGYPFQSVFGCYEIDGNQLTLVGPFAGKPRVRMKAARRQTDGEGIGRS